MSPQRPLHLRQAGLAGLGVSLFFSVYVASQATPDRRLISFLLTASFCAAMVFMMLAVAGSWRRNR